MSLTLAHPYCMSILNDLCKVVLPKSCNDPKEELSFRVVSNALVFVWQVGSDLRITESIWVKILDWELIIFWDYYVDDLVLFEDFLLIRDYGSEEDYLSRSIGGKEQSHYNDHNH
jgi:hypothetical protein